METITMIPQRYNYRNLKRAIRNPRHIVQEIQRIIEYPFKKYRGFTFRQRYGKGIDVIAEDWDNLFILDACRYDYFAAENSLNGELRPVISAGSSSWEFMAENFAGRTLHDTVYVTANPFAHRLGKDVFYTIDNVLSEWNEEIGTVTPDVVADHAREAHQEHPNKRLIVHFMQPHRPYIGPTADEIRDRVDLDGIRFDQGLKESREMGEWYRWWDAIEKGIITPEETKLSYRESLNIVLDEVRDLLSEIDRKTVVTADHGELLGESFSPITPPRYGHSFDTETIELCEVPWLEIDGNSRRDIVSEDPLGFTRPAKETVNDRLQALGYMPEDSS